MFCQPSQPDAVTNLRTSVLSALHLLSSLSHIRPEKKSLNIKFLGGIFLGHPGPRRRDIPDKNFMQVASLLF